MTLADACTAIQDGLRASQLILVVGRCKVQYVGRAASKLSEGDRLLVIKPDGTFLVHQNAKMAAINYQGPGARVVVEPIFDPNHSSPHAPVQLSVRAERALASGAKEFIDVRFYEVQFAQSFSLKDDTHLKLFGTEKELSTLLMHDLHLIEPGLQPLQRESDVRKGTIDILARDSQGRLVVIEVKRRGAGLDAVTQLSRYVHDLSRRRDCIVRGILCSPEITESSMRMLEEAGLEYYKLSYEIANPSAHIRGLQKKQKGLGEFAGEQ